MSRWVEIRPSGDISLWILNEVIKLFVRTEDIDFPIIHGKMLMMSNTLANILPLKFITDGTIIVIFGNIIDNTIKTQAHPRNLTRLM